MPTLAASGPLDAIDRRSLRRYTTARPPCAGAVATPREWQRSPAAYVVPNSNSRSNVRSVTFISMLANAAPMQRRMPPPYGIQVWVSAGCRRKRSGLNDFGVGEVVLGSVRQRDAGNDGVALGNDPLPQPDPGLGHPGGAVDHRAGALHLPDRGLHAARNRPRRPRRSSRDSRRGWRRSRSTAHASVVAVVSWPAASRVSSSSATWSSEIGEPSS